MKMKRKMIRYLLFPMLIFGIFKFSFNHEELKIFHETYFGKTQSAFSLTKKNNFNKNYSKSKIYYENFSNNTPSKDSNMGSIKDIRLYPGGQPIGIKISTKGVLVVGISDIKTEKGRKESPARLAGIEIGDTILKINNEEVTDSEDVSRIINFNKGGKVQIALERNNKLIIREINPIRCTADGKYKIGLWIRDSTSGIGTLTYYSPQNNQFAALGHGITDMDTGKIMSVRDGEIFPSTILSVKKGMKGEPGELRGIFINENKSLGNIRVNTECGIFGIAETKINNPIFTRPLPVASKNEIKTGKAQIITTIDGINPKLYDIEIEKLIKQDKPSSKSMIIKITDKELLRKTGGIVQGMSGSPIIQDGKIIGAVTHVLVNRPDVGYGIYIEWMLKDSSIIDNN